MAVESLLLTAKVGHSSEDFVRRGAFSGVSKFLCDKIFAGDPQGQTSRSGERFFLVTTHHSPGNFDRFSGYVDSASENRSNLLR